MFRYYYPHCLLLCQGVRIINAMCLVQRKNTFIWWSFWRHIRELEHRCLWATDGIRKSNVLLVGFCFLTKTWNILFWYLVACHYGHVGNKTCVKGNVQLLVFVCGLWMSVLSSLLRWLPIVLWPRSDDVSCSNLRTLTWNLKIFLTFYDVSRAKKSKVNSEVSTFHILLFGKILSEQFSVMVKNKKSHDIDETVWTTPHFFPCKM